MSPHEWTFLRAKVVSWVVTAHTLDSIMRTYLIYIMRHYVNKTLQNKSTAALVHARGKIRKYVYFVISNQPHTGQSESTKGPHNAQVCSNPCPSSSWNLSRKLGRLGGWLSSVAAEVGGREYILGGHFWTFWLQKKFKGEKKIFRNLSTSYSSYFQSFPLHIAIFLLGLLSCLSVCCVYYIRTSSSSSCLSTT